MGIGGIERSNCMGTRYFDYIIIAALPVLVITAISAQETEQGSVFGDFFYDSSDEYVDPDSGRTTTVLFEDISQASGRAPKAILMPYFSVTEVELVEISDSSGILNVRYQAEAVSIRNAQDYFKSTDPNAARFTFSHANLGRFVINLPAFQITIPTLYNDKQPSTRGFAQVRVSNNETDKLYDDLKAYLAKGKPLGFVFGFQPWIQSEIYESISITQDIVVNSVTEALSSLEDKELRGGIEAVWAYVGGNFDGQIRRRIAEQNNITKSQLSQNMRVVRVVKGAAPSLDKIEFDFATIIRDMWEKGQWKEVLSPAEIPQEYALVDVLEKGPIKVTRPAGIPIGFAVAHKDLKGVSKYTLVDSLQLHQQFDLINIKIRNTNDTVYEADVDGYRRIIGTVAFELQEHNEEHQKDGDCYGDPGVLTSIRESDAQELNWPEFDAAKGAAKYRVARLISQYGDITTGYDKGLAACKQSDFPYCAGNVKMVPSVLVYRQRPVPAGQLAEIQISTAASSSTLDISKQERAFPKDFVSGSTTVKVALRPNVPAEKDVDYYRQSYELGTGDTLRDSPCNTSAKKTKRTSEYAFVSGVLVVYQDMPAEIISLE